MCKAMDFNIRCVPPKKTAQASYRIMKRKNGTQFVGKDAKGTATQTELLLLLQDHAPLVPLEGALRVTVSWRYPWRKSEPKKNMVHGFKPCDTRPDVDNLSKFLLDCMTRLGFWNDDAQVAVLYFKKEWADVSGIGITIHEIF